MHTFNMMEKRLRFWFVTLCLILMGQSAQIADAQNPQTIEVGPHFGVSSYIGELNAWRNLDQWEWKKMNQFHYDLGVVARYNYDTRWSFRLDYTYGKLRACDTTAAWRPEAMLNFRSTLHDISCMVEFNFLDYYTGKIDKGLSPYIFAGVSGLMYVVQPYTGDATYDTLYLNNLQMDSGGADVFDVKEKRDGFNYALSIPFGVGCKISLSEHLAATIEWRMHYTLTDYLDGVHGSYAENHTVVSGHDFTDPSGQFSAGQQRGNSSTNDWFGFFNLSFTWKFVIPNNSACNYNL